MPTFYCTYLSSFFFFFFAFSFKSATLDRRSLKNGDKMPNHFGTQSRQQPSSSLDLRTKIKAIGAFTNMYLTTREAKDEELSYLE